MPELPEVETVARQLAPALVGRTVRRVELLDPLLDDPRVPALAGRRVTRVRRLGKQVVLWLAAPPAPTRWLAIHLRMTGRLHVSAVPPARGERHLRAWFELDRGWLRFVDPRRFGTVRRHDTLASARPAGREPLSPAFTAAALGALIGDTRTALKPWLLRQDRVVGLGNIYASEILFAARLDPFRPAGTLDDAELRRLHRALRRVLRAAIDNCGTTFSDFQDAHGLTGSYQHLLSVYAREGAPCPRCAAPVRRAVQQQRSTFWCAACQRTPG